MKRALFAATSMLVVSTVPALAQQAGAVTASEVEPQAYTGTWYEVARTPAPFQQECQGGVTAQYSLIDDTTMEVVNRCDTSGGETQSVSGEAEVVDGNFNTFSVEIGDEGAPGINYVVAAASEVENGQYQWAAVYSPDDKIGWILSRSAELDEEDREQARSALEEAGVAVSELSDTPQPPETYEPSAD
ncbi:lipocalin family protein [Citreimonas salinaria]|uniref:Outer membrane lipoprotein Blc n=1 Tax=Citreimonas salinaria TaxID=321339 RepID=A0A1H3LCW9_9RHOB|nr:lipocalin family protein [Citreimonas salinaria]SDY61794.1 apolipoprotein D and lipocalin family protein [Citreimonas salinaria]